MKFSPVQSTSRKQSNTFIHFEPLKWIYVVHERIVLAFCTEVNSPCDIIETWPSRDRWRTSPGLMRELITKVSEIIGTYINK